jgi:hypothetical protein
MKAVPVREIHEIELSSKCTLACPYCCHPTLQRPKDHMPWDVFERTIEHIAYLCRAGTQGEVSLTGIGEAILHPRFAEALEITRRTIGSRPLILATNGTDVTSELARLLAANDVGVYVSLHRPEVAAPAMRVLEEAGCRIGHNTAFVDSSMNWAGQVDWHVSMQKGFTCGYLSRGWAVVRQDGGVNACCMDAHGKHKLATVWDEPGSLNTYVIPLCASCNFMVPAELQEAA